jgi:hypothetical protein
MTLSKRLKLRCRLAPCSSRSVRRNEDKKDQDSSHPKLGQCKNGADYCGFVYQGVTIQNRSGKCISAKKILILCKATFRQPARLAMPIPARYPLCSYASASSRASSNQCRSQRFASCQTAARGPEAKRDDRVVLWSRRRNGFTARFLLRPSAARSQISRKRDAIVGT